MKEHCGRIVILVGALLLILCLILIIGAVDTVHRGSGFLFIPSQTPTATNTTAPTDTPTPSATMTVTATATAEPSATFTALPTDTPVPTDTLTPLPTFDETKFVEQFYESVTETVFVWWMLQTPSVTPTIPNQELYTGLKMKNPTDGKELFFIQTDAINGLAGFWIDWNEVTNADYQACVLSGACSAPAIEGCAGISDYFSSDLYQNHPVVNITKAQASAYCNWAGMVLMGSQEWESSIRMMHSMNENIDQIMDRPIENDDKSSHIIGNVWEWTHDNDENENGIIAGGSWKTSRQDIRSRSYGSMNPDSYAEDVGFRCISYVY